MRSFVDPICLGHPNHQTTMSREQFILFLRLFIPAATGMPVQGPNSAALVLSMDGSIRPTDDLLGNVLLGDEMSMMGSDDNTWNTAPTKPIDSTSPYEPTPCSSPSTPVVSAPVTPVGHMAFNPVTCPPVPLTRHMSLPASFTRTDGYEPLNTTSMSGPPTLVRHRSQGYYMDSYQNAPGMGMAHPGAQAMASLHAPLAMNHSFDLEPINFGGYSAARPSQSPVTEDQQFDQVLDCLDGMVQDLFQPGAEAAHGTIDGNNNNNTITPRAMQPSSFQSSILSPHAFKTVSRTSKSTLTCKVMGCDRRVRSKGFCKTHGGGRKCSIVGCKKSSQNGEFCIGHGGGKKCKQEGCAKAAQSHGLCKAHGGGARCKFPNCNKSSQGGGLCRAHGGGKRCQAEGCPKGAQRGNFCATHGGFRNCKADGCVRTDRGGGYCEVHRRDKLCTVEGCKKLARNQGKCTMHIREDKQETRLRPEINSLMAA